MKGFIKLEAEPTENGCRVKQEVNLEQVDIEDKVILFSAFLDSLEIPIRLVPVICALAKMRENKKKEKKGK